jgi:hypothetical protein
MLPIRMIRHKPLLLNVVLLLLFKIAISQEQVSVFDPVYGADPELFNGQIYKYFVAGSSKGNQFYSSPEFIKGSLIIKGFVYPDVSLNYDVYNQEILLVSKNPIYNNTIISLSQAWIEKFYLGNDQFELIIFQDSSRRICQVTGFGNVRILTCWRKERRSDLDYNTPIYVFTRPHKSRFVQIGKEIKPFNNKKSFISCFPVTDRAKISKHIKQSRIKLKKANQQKLEELVTYCNTLFN